MRVFPATQPGGVPGTYSCSCAPLAAIAHYSDLTPNSPALIDPAGITLDYSELWAWIRDVGRRLEDAGIHGNMHEMFLDRNSDEIIKFIDGWINKNVK